MDIRDENNYILETVQSEETPSTPEVDILGQTSNPLHLPPFPTGTPAPPQPASDPQTGGFFSNILPEPAPPVYQQLVPLMVSAPAHLYSQPGTDRQGQLRHPECNALRIPETMTQYERPFGELHDVPFWDFVPPAPPSNPPLRPPFPTGDPAPPQSALDPQIGGFLSHTLLETAPPVSQQLVPLMVTNTATVPAHLYSQPGTDRQGLLRHPEVNVPGIPQTMTQYVRPAGELHDVPFWEFVPPAPLSNPPLRPPFPTGDPAPPQSPLDPQIGGFLSHTLLETAPPVSQQLVPLMVTNTATVPAHLYSQPGTDRQGLLRHPEGNVPGIPQTMTQYVRPAGELHGVPFWDFVPPAPPSNTSTTKKRKCEAKQDEDRLYIKKPPNAFMIYLKEQRPKVMAELNLTGSAAINAVVGKRWRSLSKAQQAKYFDQAETERCRHATEHPDWSTKENYGKKRTRTRNHTSSTASEPKQEAQQAKRLCVMPAQTQPSSSYSVAKEPLEQPQRQPTVTNLRYQQSACVQLQNTQTTVDAPVCQVNPVLPASRIDFSPSASLASSAAPVQLQKDATFVSDTDEALLSVVEQLDPLLTSEQSQQPSSPLTGHHLNQTNPASPVYTSLSTSFASSATFFQDQKEPIGFADIQEDMWTLLNHLPATLQPDTLSCPNIPTLISPASLENSSPSKLLASSVAPTECQSTPPFFSQTVKNMMWLLDDLEPGPFAQPLQPSSPQADWSSP
ncbi:putative transcription factor SOX-14 isoform X2 [Oreochromis niloticus]|uniref:putative transcription factor SOX-14 isoform X2 n=1 Tax=Oreochromis niloticus TaxID=8128 RepID=UPI0009055E40|nr:putative transcription factor SOX-14 isoform X2 [Oreochromis niloticus]